MAIRGTGYQDRHTKSYLYLVQKQILKRQQRSPWISLLWKPLWSSRDEHPAGCGVWQWMRDKGSCPENAHNPRRKQTYGQQKINRGRKYSLNATVPQRTSSLGCGKGRERWWGGPMVGVGVSVTFQAGKEARREEWWWESGVYGRTQGKVMLEKSAGVRTPHPMKDLGRVCAHACLCQKAFSEQWSHLNTWKGGAVLMRRQGRSGINLETGKPPAQRSLIHQVQEWRGESSTHTRWPNPSYLLALSDATPPHHPTPACISLSFSPPRPFAEGTPGLPGSRDAPRILGVAPRIHTSCPPTAG